MRYTIDISLLSYDIESPTVSEQSTQTIVPTSTVSKPTNSDTIKKPVPPMIKHVKSKKKKKRTGTGNFNPMNDAPKTKSRKVTSFRSLVEYIKSTETFQAKPYWDIKQYSVGYGTKAENKNIRVTKADATRRLIKHVTPDFRRVKRAVMKSGKLNMSYVYALTDLTYNIGFGWAYGKGNSLGGYVRKGYGAGVKRKILLYNKARVHGVLKPLRGLTIRRQAEASWITDKNLPDEEPPQITEQNTNSSTSSIPQNSYSPNFPTSANTPQPPPIKKTLKSETKIAQTSLLNYSIIKDYKKHFNVHQMLLTNVSSEHLDILSNKNTRVRITVNQYNGSKMMENEFTVKNVKIVKREVDSSYVLELILINSVVNSLMTKNMPHIVVDSTTIYEPLSQISKNVKEIFGKKLLILTNASTIDYNENVLENMFEVNENYNKFKYEQIIIPQTTIHNQLEHLLNNHYNVFNVPAMWLIDDATFTTKHSDNLALYVFDPTQTKLMVMNSFKGITDEIGGRILKRTKLFDQETTLNILNQNFVLNKASGFFVDNNKSSSTANVVLPDSIEMFNKRKQSMIDWVNESPEIMVVEFKGIDLTKVRHIEQYDLDNDDKYESTLLNSIVLFKPETSDLADQSDKVHDLRFVADKICQFYKHND